jgi:hypothetical protein
MRQISRVLAEHERVLRISKLKDGEDGSVYPFKLEPVEVDQDDA